MSGRSTSKRSAGRGVGIVEERVKLDRQPAVVAGGADGRDDLGEIDGAGAGHKVVMHPAGGDVFEVVVPDVRRQLGDRPGQVFADAERVADVEIEADRRGVQPLGDFEVLVGRLQQQARLGLDQEQDAQVMGVLGQRFQDLDEEVDRLAAAAARRERAAGLGRDVRRAQLGAQASARLRVVDPDLAVMRLGLDERRMPVGLAVVVDGVHHEGVDVRERQPRSLHRPQDRALLHVEQTGRPGVRHVGQQFQALVAECGDPGGRFVEGMFQVGVGAEGESHGGRRFLIDFGGWQSRRGRAAQRRSRRAARERSAADGSYAEGTPPGPRGGVHYMIQRGPCCA